MTDTESAQVVFDGLLAVVAVGGDGPGWVTYARRDWAEYLAARAADLGEPIPDE